MGELTNNKSIAHNIANIDAIVDIQGTAYMSTGQTLKINYVNSLSTSTYFASVIADKTNISILMAGLPNRMGYVTLYYTKTTD